MDRQEALRRDEGNAFQIVGAWYEKDLCPWDLVLTFGITRSFSELDQRERDGWYSDTNGKSNQQFYFDIKFQNCAWRRSEVMTS